MCDRPLNAWQAPDSMGPNFTDVVDYETGEFQRCRHSRPLSFSPVAGWVQMSVPCGKCNGCLLAESRVWSIRAYHESQCHEQNSFLTLTFSDDCLPLDGKICKEHMQLFFKRLRRRSDIPPIRYFYCGEYGDLTNRPHYHALIFGADFMDSRAVLWKDDQYLHPILQQVWGQGMVTHATVNFARCAYVAGYVTKKVGCPDVFRHMSRDPGLGAGWLKSYADDIRRLGGCMVEGTLLPVPSFYYDKADLQEVKSRAREVAIATDIRLMNKGRHRAAHESRRVNHKFRIDKQRGGSI